MSYATEVVLRIKADVLLKSIWYSDGSGAYATDGAGLDGTSDEWYVAHATLDEATRELVLRLRRCDPK